ncbi:hypothetical protein OH807_05725 [Kitasatospora sp. NBC_01560]|uniref:hypothetical protein n=1 Tax=Kitasatospora sp. NBC_01560 TaxID=2975965 RepID=UPI0038686BE5
MSETQAVMTAARPLRTVGPSAVLPRRPERASTPAVRPDRGEEEPADGPSADGGRHLRGRAAHCRAAMGYVD